MSANNSDGNDLGPPPPPQADDNVVQDEPEYDPSEFEEDEDEASQFPISHEVVSRITPKVVSALALDPSGARVVSGSHDYDCKLWDFGGMDMRCKPFKSWEPAGSYHVCLNKLSSYGPVADIISQIHDLKFSNDGRQFLCISGTIQAKLFDRDGEEQCVLVGPMGASS